MNTHDGNEKRNERLHVRLTTLEAAYIAIAAKTRGESVSDYVRKTLLRRSGIVVLAARRRFALERAEHVRVLNALANELRALKNSGALSRDDVQPQLARIAEIIERYG